MNKAQIIAMQERIGTTADGFWGPESIAACQKHLRSLMPSPNPWPATDQSSLTSFYGAAGDESKLTNLDVRGLGLKYDGSSVKSVRCHAKVASSLHRILTAISLSPHAWVLAEYAGVYNNRNMRGNSLPSIHARGSAIDLAPGTNGNKTSWPVSATMPLEVMEMFSKEGWLSAGAFWGRDGMHFQATR
jgi:hypothetical protein